MPILRPLACALLVALTASLASPVSLAAKKKPAARKPAATAAAAACKDLYADANKGWLTANPMPESGAISALGQLNARALEQQRTLLDGFMRAPQNEAQKLLGDFWASGLDEAAVEADGAAPIAPLLKRIDAIRSSKDIAPAIAALHQVGIPVVFGFNADLDLRDLDRHLGYFVQGGLGLPDPAYYTRTDADTRALMARYADYMRKILRLTGVPDAEIETQTAFALDVEKRIAEASRPLSELRDPRRNFAPVATAGLGKQYRNLQLDAFLKAQGVSDDTVSIADPALFGRLDAMLGQLKPAQWQAYLRWRVGDAMAPYLSRPWRETAFEFRNKVLLGQHAAPPRWQQVLDAINLAAGPMLGRQYTAAYLPDATRTQAGQIADQVRQALHQAIEQGELLQGSAKAEALKKLDALTIEIGAPAREPEVSLQPMGRGSFGSNMLIAATWRHRLEMRRIGKGNAGRRWDVLPQQPALAYDLAHNRLIVTAAMLQLPVFDPSMPAGHMYGAFGALVGHELSHAIDAIGRHVDADGTVRDWWSREDAERWQRKADAVAAFYDRLPYPGLPDTRVNGTLTRDENMADMAGLTLAHAALKSHATPLENATLRSFYIGWAQLWAQQVSSDEARLRAAQDVRAPGPWRANAPAMQQADFATAFGCKPDAPMVLKPDARIEIF